MIVPKDSKKSVYLSDCDCFSIQGQTEVEIRATNYD